MQIDPSQPSPRGAFFVQAFDRIILRSSLLTALALAAVLASAQVVPNHEAKTHSSLNSAVTPGVDNTKVAHKPDASESKALIDRQTQRTRGYIANKGQWPPNVKFMARSNGLNLWVTGEGLRVDAYSKTTSAITGHVVGVKFDGAKRLDAKGITDIGSRTDFLNSSNSVRGAHTYKEVTSENIYPHIELKNYFEGPKPRFDFNVAPGGDPTKIKMTYIAAEGLTVDRDKLSVKTSIGDLVESNLVAYQVINGKRRPVSVAFNKIDKDTIGFKVGNYDHSKTLVIDPLIYGSYYGGDSGMDEVHATVSDVLGGTYLTGQTKAPDFPAIFGPYSFSLRGGQDAFVAKLQGDVYRHDYAAFLGAGLSDAGDFLQLDQFGDLWVAGRTTSPDFPGSVANNVQYISYDDVHSRYLPGTVFGVPSGGARFRIRLPGMSNGGTWSGYIPWNASPAVVQNTIQTYLNNVIGVGVVLNVTGPSTILNGAFQITFTPDIQGLMQIDSRYLGAVYEDNHTKARAQLLSSLGTASTGTYAIAVAYSRGGGNFTGHTNALAFNATPATVQTAINTLNADPADPNQTKVNMGALVQGDGQGGGGNALPFIILFPTPEAAMTIAGSTVNATYFFTALWIDEFFWNPLSSIPTGPIPSGNTPPDPNAAGGAWNLAINGTWSTPVVRFNTTAQQLHDALASTGAVDGADVVVIPEGGTTMPTAKMAAVYVRNSAGTNPGTVSLSMVPVIIGVGPFGATAQVLSEALLAPQAIYKCYANDRIFVMRFKQDTSTFLNPLPTKSFFFGGGNTPDVRGFRIIPHDNPTPGEPIRMTFGGTAFGGGVPEVPGNQRATPSGFILRVNFTDANGFSVVQGASQYLDAYDSQTLTGYPVLVGGIDVDANANVYVGGTLVGGFGNTIDLATRPDLFATTPVDSLGTLRDGRLMRWGDQFARKYSSTGALTYSVLIGGDGFDDCEGVAVDGSGDAYVLGTSQSFNFPRTRGVYGETFTAAYISTCAKLNATASDLIYGTHLHTANSVTPVGIAVDSRGIAFMTFMLDRGTIFRPWLPNNDPNLCDGFEFLGQIPTTADALVGGAYAGGQFAGGDYGGTDGGLIALNPSGTNIVYGTRLGGNLDDQVYRPYVDKSGDVWVCGWTDTYRYYERPAAWHPFVAIFNVKLGLPASMISPLAFRPAPDPNNGHGGSGTTFLENVLYNTELDEYPSLWDVWKDRDGWVDRIRLGLASVSGVGFAPGTIPGGLGAASTGTVTLSQNAPAGGAVIALTMPASAPASFVSGSTVSSTSITIPAGVRTGTFTVFSEQVSDNTPVDVTASYQGNFKVGRLVVVPWLQSFSITPTEVVGGSAVTGTIQLSALAGSGGVNVQLTSDLPALVNVPAIITVPPGQTATAFNIGTNGVDADATVTLTASLLGVGKPFQIIVHPSQLKALTFKPSPVTSGTSTIGTVVVTGDPGPGGFDVNLSVEGSPAGYTLTPNKLHFVRGTNSLPFTMTTPYESQTVNRTVDAVMAPTAGYTPNTVKGTISVTANQITSFTLTPNPINGGATCVGKVTLSTAALEGGAKVDVAVSPSNGTVVVPAKVTVLQGQTTLSFNIPTTTTIAEQLFNITVSRGASTITKVLDVLPLTFTLTAPSVIAGGSSGSGSVILSGPAPAGGVAVKLTSSNPSLLPVPDTIAMTSGQSQVTFTLNAGAVTTDTDVIISAKIGTVTHSVTVTVHASTLKSTGLTIMPNYVLNLKTIRFSLTLDGPAPSGGLQVMLTSTNPSIASVPSLVTIPAGATSYSFSVATRRVSKTLMTSVTATATNGGQASATLTVHP